MTDEELLDLFYAHGADVFNAAALNRLERVVPMQHHREAIRLARKKLDITPWNMRPLGRINDD